MKKHWVVVFGGAVAGSEAAAIMADKGVNVVLFEQNALPYGKIEYGLPKWHIKLRDKQERNIDEKINHPNIYFVPLCKLGRDIDFNDVCTCWGVNAVLLATGAWLDRPFPVKEIESFTGKGFYYQNPLVHWFNQKDDPAYTGESCQVEDGAIIVGGGLASIDVAKILMIETFQKAIAHYGKSMDVFSIERLGLPKAADMLGLSINDLGLKGCTIFYRRRMVDMPLSANPAENTPEAWEKTHAVRLRILSKAREKYLFKVVDRHSPESLLVKNDRINGLVFRENRVAEDGRIIPTNILHKIEAPLVISSIGSIPEPIEGLELTGEYIQPVDEKSGQCHCVTNVFVLGNAITGKGNIKESLQHGRRVSEIVASEFLGLGDEDNRDEIEIKTPVARQVAEINNVVGCAPFPLPDEVRKITDTIKRLQEKAGYNGDYKEWIQAHLPVRLEDILKKNEKENK